MSALIPALIDLLISRLRQRGGGGGGGGHASGGGGGREPKPQKSPSQRDREYWDDELYSQKRLQSLGREGGGGGGIDLPKIEIPSWRKTYTPPAGRQRD